ncbi:hypothetical protein A6E14_13575 [Vibrio genomosp. F10]|uniref:Uncharacterized protein n=1 Tax=Vibrio genomosp. F10 TaxID=723171 RepID=A0A1B9QWH6_9VIBR|nr:hypothetical protein A6E14_13575 [Vibrio genomosp. F10]
MSVFSQSQTFKNAPKNREHFFASHVVEQTLKGMTRKIAPACLFIPQDRKIYGYNNTKWREYKQAEGE